MSGEKEEQTIQPLQAPSIKKIIQCPACGKDVEVEFEIELAPLIPALGGPFMSMMSQPAKGEEKTEPEEEK